MNGEVKYTLIEKMEGGVVLVASGDAERFELPNAKEAEMFANRKGFVINIRHERKAPKIN